MADGIDDRKNEMSSAWSNPDSSCGASAHNGTMSLAHGQ